MACVQEVRRFSTLDNGTAPLIKSTEIHSAAPVLLGILEEPPFTLTVIDLVKANNVYHPIHWPAWKRWGIVTIYCALQVFVCMSSTSYVSVETLIQEKWGGSTQVVTLGQSLFLLGTSIGPVFLGPLS
jgi:hypothetical protein